MEYRGPRVVVVGWDGGCMPYLEGLLAEGRLPNLARLRAEGASGLVHSSVPSMTPVAWSSIFTGCNPGKHGVYNWWRPVGDHYSLKAHDSTSIQVPHLFQLLSSAQVKIGAIHAPMTKPPFPVHGFLIGDVTHPNMVADWKLAAYPEAVAAAISARHPDYCAFDTTAFEQVSTNAELLEIWQGFEKRRLHLIADLVTREQPELLWVHCHIGDYLGHRERSDSAVLADAFQLIDGTIGTLRSLADPAATALVVSDHGQSEIHKFILIQNWLEERGLLHFKPEIPKQQFGNTLLRLLDQGDVVLDDENLIDTVVGFSELYYNLPDGVRPQVAHFVAERVPGALKDHFNIDWSRTRAYGCEFNGLIRINLEGREAQGIVSAQEYDQLVDEVCRALTELQDPETGSPVGVRAFRREELYTGDAVHSAPDIVCTPSDPTYYFCQIHALHLGEGEVVVPIDHDRLKRTFRFLDQEYYGDHSAEGFFAVAGPRVAARGQQKPLRVVEIAPTLLHHLGLEIPAHMDGQARIDLLPGIGE